MFDKLEGLVKIYNNEQCGKAYLQRYVRCVGENKDKSAAIVTPLMPRVHMHIQQSKEIVFIDSTASLDHFSSPTYIVSTASPAGGIPLAVVVTSSENTVTLTEAFKQQREIMPQSAFYGNGRLKGPTITLTDDSTSERNSLRSTWADTKLLLCIFHYLQSWWTWLWEKENGIEKRDKITIVRHMVYSNTENALEEHYRKLVSANEEIPCKYPNVRDRAQTHWETRHEWALCTDKLLLLGDITPTT